MDRAGAPTERNREFGEFRCRTGGSKGLLLSARVVPKVCCFPHGWFQRFVAFGLDSSQAKGGDRVEDEQT
jgi:hypothetical protein